ncbi:MAG: hypothetical protein HC809_07245 [Gammaproteobacteria bacterium]|nr:hypothetical protein [Gammaproteobacteria bacterium]
MSAIFAAILALPLLLLASPRAIVPVGVDHPAAFAWLAAPLPMWVLWLWLVGAIARGTQFAHRFRRQQRKVEGLERCSDEPIECCSRDLERAMGIESEIFLKFDAIAGPYSFVGRRTFIVMPRRARAWPHWMVKAALAHELIHIRRGDHRTLIGLRIVQSVYWFLPMLGALERSCHRALEESCDDEACRFSEFDEQYALALGAIASGERNPFDANGLGRRISRFLRPRNRLARAALAQLAVAATTLLALTAATFQPVAKPAAMIHAPSAHALANVHDATHTGRRFVALNGTLQISPRTQLPNAVYPGAALLQGVQGEVAIDYTIARDGTVIAAHVSRSDHPLLAVAALRAVYSTEWTVTADSSAFRGAQAAQAQVREEFYFRMREDRTLAHRI